MHIPTLKIKLFSTKSFVQKKKRNQLHLFQGHCHKHVNLGKTIFTITTTCLHDQRMSGIIRML